MAGQAKLPDELLSTIQSYDNWAEGELLKVQEATKVVDTLYHYTNVAGLRGIIESENLWFTDYRHMNDPSEIIHGIEMAHDAIRRLKSGNSDGRLLMYLDLLADMMSADNFSRALEYFIGSFSRTRDDLGQWRAYGDNGRGIAIGFAPHLFRIENPVDVRPDRAAFVGPVTYDIAQSLERQTEPIWKSAQTFIEAANSHRELVAKKEIGIPFMQDMARAVIASPLIWNCLTSKHPAYEHEREVRLIIMGMHSKLKPFIKTRLRGSEIVPYIAYSMEVRKEHSIAEIVVGPAAGHDAERTVTTMLESLGLKHRIAISRSNIPYRPV